MWTIIKRISRINQIILIIFLILVIPHVSYSNVLNTYLKRKATDGNLKRVTYYLKNGADVNSADKRGQTPLMAAIFGAWLAQELKKSGHQRKRGQHIEVVKTLLAYGSDVNAKDEKGNAAIYWAAKIKNTEILEILLAHGANVNAINNSGSTAISVATLAELPDSVRILINNGADVNLGVHKGVRNAENTLMMAKRRYSDKKTAERTAIIEMLIAAGAKPIEVKKKKRITQKTAKPKKAQPKKIAKKGNEQFLKSNNVMEIIQFDQYGLYHDIILKNKRGKVVAKKLIMRNRYNPLQITGELIRDVADKDIHYTETEGTAKNPMWICLDKDGNIVKKAEKPVLVKSFQAIQKTKFKIKYNGAFKDKKYTIFYPCSNCASKTGIKDCVYVW